MAEENRTPEDAMTGSALQDSQSGGETGEFGGNRDQQQSGQAAHGGQQLGGGATSADFDQAGGSSGTGGYGNAQNQMNHQGQQSQAAYGNSEDAQQSRGEAFDEQQGGGRGPEAIAPPGEISEFQQDQQQHQDRGQSAVEDDSEPY